MSYRKERNFSFALRKTERVRRFLGVASDNEDIVIMLAYFRTLVDLATPPANRFPYITTNEAAFLISDMINSRVAYESRLVLQICELASELELPTSMVEDYHNKWLNLTARVMQLYQQHLSVY